MSTANSMRLSHSKQGSLFIVQMTMIAVATALFVGATVLSAQTAPPANLANARAEEFEVAKITVLDTNAPMPRPVFSRGGDRLAYVHLTSNAEKKYGIVIVSLPGGERRQTIDLSQWIVGIAWSPDGTRILAIDDDKKGYIIEVSTTKIIPIGGVSGVRWARGDEIIWADEKSVYFIQEPSVGIARFDLDTLSSTYAVDVVNAGFSSSVTGLLKDLQSGGFEAKTSAAHDAYNALAAQLRKTPVDHPYVTLGTTLGGGGGFDINRSTVIAAFNRDGSFTRVLVPGGFQTATFSPNASHAVVEYFGGQLRLLTMGTRQRPRLALEATLAPMPNPIQASDLAGIRASIAQGRIVYADVFRPRINPLNQRTVGAVGSSKGLVRIVRLGDDGTLEARFVREVDGYPATGDVLQTFWTPQPNQTEFRSVSAVVGPLRDLPASPIETAVAKESTAADPDKIVLDAFDAYINGNTADIMALMSDEGIKNAKSYCSGDAANCLRNNHSGRGRFQSRSAEVISRDAARARVRLISTWQNNNSGAADATRCQTYNLSLTETGWRIDYFDVPGTCRQ